MRAIVADELLPFDRAVETWPAVQNLEGTETE